MELPVLVAMAGALGVFGIYIWWVHARKSDEK
jgi:hypothetical protein